MLQQQEATKTKGRGFHGLSMHKSMRQACTNSFSSSKASTSTVASQEGSQRRIVDTTSICQRLSLLLAPLATLIVWRAAGVAF